MVQNREIAEEFFEAKLNSYITRTIARVKQCRGAALFNSFVLSKDGI
jgi:hypothetical protein